MGLILEEPEGSKRMSLMEILWDCLGSLWKPWPLLNADNWGKCWPLQTDFTLAHPTPCWMFLPRCSVWEWNLLCVIFPLLPSVRCFEYFWTENPHQNASVFTNFTIYHPGRLAEDKGQGGRDDSSIAVLWSDEQKSLLEASRSRWEL